MKKDLYTYFSKDFFKKKAEVEQISNNVQMIKRPYRAVAKEIKIYVHGIESIFILAYGIGSTYWVMSGAYALSGNLNRKLFYWIGGFLLANFMTDFMKSYYIHSLYKNQIKDIHAIYKFTYNIEL